MNLLVCGGAGFIGSAFIRNYLENNTESKILNLDILTIGSNLENLKNVENNSKYVAIFGVIFLHGPHHEAENCINTVS